MQSIQNNMEQQFDSDNLLGWMCGMIGGCFHFLRLPLLEMGYFESLAKAGTTALVCGVLGIAGKYAFTKFIKPAFEKWFDKKKKKK